MENSTLRRRGLAIQTGARAWHWGVAIAGTGQAAGERFAAAHRALRADPDIQFDLHRAEPPHQAPAWLTHFLQWLGKLFEPVGRFFSWIGSFMPDAPYARIFLWSVLAAAAGGLLWMLWMRAREGAWRLPKWRRRRVAADAAVEEEAWQPEAAPAREWLEEADRFAEQGRYAEAAHHLLIRSIEDIGRRRPGLVRPALTSRDLACAQAVPPRARQLFSGIAQVVERSLFGGRDVDARDWSECRTAYADFAKIQAWKAA